MADTQPPAVTPVEDTKTTTTVTKETKSGNSGMKIVLIIGVVLLCLCIICSVAGWLIYQSTLTASQGLLNTISNELEDQMNNDFNSTNPDTDTTDPNDTPDEDFSNDDNYVYGTELPAGFPNDVPIPTNATVGFGGSSTDSNGEVSYNVTLTSPSTVAELLSFYKSNLGTLGWTITGEQSFFGTSVTAEKSGREVTVVLLGDDSEDTAITIGVN